MSPQKARRTEEEAPESGSSGEAVWPEEALSPEDAAEAGAEAAPAGSVPTGASTMISRVAAASDVSPRAGVSDVSPQDAVPRAFSRSAPQSSAAAAEMCLFWFISLLSS